MTVLITLTTAGADSGPFNLYTNLDGYVSAFATGVSKSALLAGYTSSAVPDFATIIRVKSNGDCVNYIDIVLTGLTTTTTTTAVAAALWDVSTLSNGSRSIACTYSVDQNLFAAAIPSGVLNITRLYTNAGLTNGYPGFGNFYRIREGSNFFSITIDASGYVTNILACS